MADKQPKRFPFSFDDIDRLIGLLVGLDKGVIAEKLNLDRDPSYVSKQKAALAALLKGEVLEDGGPHGKQLTEQAKKLLEALVQARQVVEAALAPGQFGSVRLRLGTIPSVLASFMPLVFKELAETDYFGRHPEVALHTESGSARQLFDRLDRGLLDLVITYPLRDENLATRPAKKTTKREGEREWHPVQMDPWIAWSDLHDYELFPGRPVGLIYHKSNKAMAKLAAGSGPFSFQPLARMMVFLTSDPNQQAFESEIESCLPPPESKAGTRVYLQTFNQIRAALTRGGEVLQEKAVGVGVELNEGDHLKFLDFRGLAKRVPETTSDRQAVDRLAILSTQQFFLYRKSAQSRPTVKSEYFQDFANCIIAASEKHPHPHGYVS